MKRPYSSTVESLPVDDIRKDIPQAQLAAIGSVALSYNYAETTINRMLYFTVGMPIALHAEVSSRINGVDGKIAIIKAGAAEMGVQPNYLQFLADTLGEGGFSLLKKYRDAVIHARIINRVTGVGELIESRGRHVQVLLSEKALDGLYDRLEAVRMELAAFLKIFDCQSEINSLRRDDDPDREQLAAKILKFFALAQKYRNRRLSLPPLPEFPDQAELHKLENQGPLASPEPLLGVLNVGTLGLAAIGRADSKKPQQK
jgi:hypothetical protein